MEIVKITLEISLDEEQASRVDAAAEWMGQTRQEFMEKALHTGLWHHIRQGLEMTERLMAQYPSRAAALEALEKDGARR